MQIVIPHLADGHRQFAGILVLVLCATLTIAAHADENRTVTLRDAFYGTVEEQVPMLVGKVGIALVEPTGVRQVSLDHVFSSGDKFRFLISSNTAGYLYILHRSKDDDVTQLWPRPNTADTFNIRSNQTYTVPTGPGVLIFDENIGNEQFYIAVRSEPKVPQLSGLDSKDLPQSDDRESNKVAKPDVLIDTPEETQPLTSTVEWVIRGDPFGEGSSRGVVFDPGPVDSDLYRYFSAVPGDGDSKAMIQVMLSHQH